jgi:hypothetical protein
METFLSRVRDICVYGTGGWQCYLHILQANMYDAIQNIFDSWNTFFAYLNIRSLQQLNYWSTQQSILTRSDTCVFCISHLKGKSRNRFRLAPHSNIPANN